MVEESTQDTSDMAGSASHTQELIPSRDVRSGNRCDKLNLLATGRRACHQEGLDSGPFGSQPP